MSSRSIVPREVQVPRILRIEQGIIEEVPPILAEGGISPRTVVVVTGAGSSDSLGMGVVNSFHLASPSVRHVRGGQGSIQTASRLANRLDDWQADAVVGVGGGRVIDVAKLAATYAGVQFVSVPTSLSHDGISSPVASLPDEAGLRRSLAASMPVGVLVDTGVVSSAPVGTLRAGLGDLLSNLTALMDWRLAASRRKETMDEFSALIAEHAALPLLGVSGLSDPVSVGVLAKGLVLSGLAMATARTSRPCSGAEHLISHSLDAVLGQEARLHGQQVAIGTLVAAHAHGQLYEEIRNAFVRCGVATHPRELSISLDLLEQAVISAPSTRPGRYTILDELDLAPDRVRSLLADVFKEDGS